MNLPDKIQLADDLLEISDEITVGQYFVICNTIEFLLKAKEMKYTCLRDEHRAVILKLAERMGVVGIRKETGLAFVSIYKVLDDANFDIKAATQKRRLAERKQKDVERLAAVESRRPPVPIAPTKREPMKRPPAEYSNRSPFGIASEYLNQKAAL